MFFFVPRREDEKNAFATAIKNTVMYEAYLGSEKVPKDKQNDAYLLYIYKTLQKTIEKNPTIQTRGFFILDNLVVIDIDRLTHNETGVEVEGYKNMLVAFSEFEEEYIKENSLDEDSKIYDFLLCDNAFKSSSSKKVHFYFRTTTPLNPVRSKILSSASYTIKFDVLAYRYFINPREHYRSSAPNYVAVHPETYKRITEPGKEFPYLNDKQIELYVKQKESDEEFLTNLLQNVAPPKKVKDPIYCSVDDFEAKLKILAQIPQLQNTGDKPFSAISSFFLLTYLSCFKRETNFRDFVFKVFYLPAYAVVENENSECAPPEIEDKVRGILQDFFANQLKYDYEHTRKQLLSMKQSQSAYQGNSISVGTFEMFFECLIDNPIVYPIINTALEKLAETKAESNRIPVDITEKYSAVNNSLEVKITKACMDSSEKLYSSLPDHNLVKKLCRKAFAYDTGEELCIDWVLLCFTSVVAAAVQPHYAVRTSSNKNPVPLHLYAMCVGDTGFGKSSYISFFEKVASHLGVETGGFVGSKNGFTTLYMPNQMYQGQTDFKFGEEAFYRSLYSAIFKSKCSVQDEVFTEAGSYFFKSKNGNVPSYQARIASSLMKLESSCKIEEDTIKNELGKTISGAVFTYYGLTAMPEGKMQDFNFDNGLGNRFIWIRDSAPSISPNTTIREANKIYREKDEDSFFKFLENFFSSEEGISYKNHFNRGFNLEQLSPEELKSKLNDFTKTLNKQISKRFEYDNEMEFIKEKLQTYRDEQMQEGGAGKETITEKEWKELCKKLDVLRFKKLEFYLTANTLVPDLVELQEETIALHSELQKTQSNLKYMRDFHFAHKKRELDSKTTIRAKEILNRFFEFEIPPEYYTRTSFLAIKLSSVLTIAQKENVVPHELYLLCYDYISYSCIYWYSRTIKSVINKFSKYDAHFEEIYKKCMQIMNCPETLKSKRDKLRLKDSNLYFSTTMSKILSETGKKFSKDIGEQIKKLFEFVRQDFDMRGEKNVQFVVETMPNGQISYRINFNKEYLNVQQ